jgi:DNA-binding GntR family transcriptional regulator
MPVGIVKPLENVSLGEQAYQLIKRQIVDGRLAPGEKLDILELSKALGVSRSPIKDALNRLALEGMLTVHPQRGTFVSTIGADDIEQLFDARLMIELWAARRGARQPHSFDLAKMENILEQCASLLRSEDAFEYAAYNNGDVAFHTAIVEAAANPRLNAFYRSLKAHIQAMRVYWGRAYHRAMKSHQEHQEILETLKQGRYPEIRKILTRHIVGSKNHLLSLLREDPTHRTPEPVP